MRLGLIINPLAGIGGPVGLKGSDGVEIQRLALKLGAEPQSPQRAKRALETLLPLKGKLQLFTPPGVMGQEVACKAGFEPVPIGSLPHGPTTAEDTIRLAQELFEVGIDLLLFAGGDGTARDMCTAVGTRLPVLGIPAGVKIYSAVFATHPRTAGEVAATFLNRLSGSGSTGEAVSLREAEVVDLDEDSYRAGTVSVKLWGYLLIPFMAHRIQNRKAPSPLTEAASLEAIAAAVIESMPPGWLYVLGPGTTTQAIARRLGFSKTLVGVDVYRRDEVVDLDVGERRLWELTQNYPTKIVVSPLGGQGFLFGRGNQPIGARVIQKVGRENILVVSTVEKLNALRGEPLLVDTGDPATDSLLKGYLPVITGYRERIIYPVKPTSELYNTYEKE